MTKYRIYWLIPDFYRLNFFNETSSRSWQTQRTNGQADNKRIHAPDSHVTDEHLLIKRGFSLHRAPEASAICPGQRLPINAPVGQNPRQMHKRTCPFVRLHGVGLSIVYSHIGTCQYGALLQRDYRTDCHQLQPASHSARHDRPPSIVIR